MNYLVAQDEGHGLDNPINALAVFRATEKFLGACLNGRIQKTVDPHIENQLKQMTVDIKALKLGTK